MCLPLIQRRKVSLLKGWVKRDSGNTKKEGRGEKGMFQKFKRKEVAKQGQVKTRGSI